jgi:hypothetical protein
MSFPYSGFAKDGQDSKKRMEKQIYTLQSYRIKRAQKMEWRDKIEIVEYVRKMNREDRLEIYANHISNLICIILTVVTSVLFMYALRPVWQEKPSIVCIEGQYSAKMDNGSYAPLVDEANKTLSCKSQQEPEKEII